jgi:hypothetical protein
MKFFVPSSNESNINQVYSSIKKHTEKMLGKPVSDKKIFALIYNYHNQTIRAEVGTTYPKSEEKILAIFESDPFAIYVADPRQKFRLIHVGVQEIERIEEFES